MPLFSHQTDIGCAPPPLAVLEFSTLRASEFTYFIYIWLVTDPFSRSIVDELKPAYADVREEARQPECVSIAWSADGQTLFAGFTDNALRVWTVTS